MYQSYRLWVLVITMNLDLNNVKLVKDGNQIKNVFIDDKEVKGVIKITYTTEADSVNTVIIEMIVNDLKIDEQNEKDVLLKRIKDLEREIIHLKVKGMYEEVMPYEPYIPPKVWYYKYDKPLDY
jgi:hypothetical protein